MNPFVANTDLVRDVPGYSTLNFFNSMFEDSNFDSIAEETNQYARQAMQTKLDPAWRETNAEEVKAFFALNILFGIKQSLFLLVQKSASQSPRSAKDFSDESFCENIPISSSKQ